MLQVPLSTISNVQYIFNGWIDGNDTLVTYEDSFTPSDSNMFNFIVPPIFHNFTFSMSAYNVYGQGLSYTSGLNSIRMLFLLSLLFTSHIFFCYTNNLFITACPNCVHGRCTRKGTCACDIGFIGDLCETCTVGFSSLNNCTGNIIYLYSLILSFFLSCF